MLDLKDSIKWGNKLSLKSINFHQITNAKDILSLRDYIKANMKILSTKITTIVSLI